MFPIPWNFPLRKKNGNLVNIGDAIDAGTEIPEHDEGDAGKVLSVDENGDLEWSDVPTEIPEHGEGDAGKVLSVDENGDLEWSDDVSSEIQTLTNNVDVLIENGAVNLAENKGTTTTHRGITFTVNADGTVTASGTNDGTGDSTIILAQTAADHLETTGTYKLSGCPSGGSDSTYYLVIYQGGFGADDYGDGVVFTNNNYGSLKLACVVKSGTDLATDITFKPMIAPVDYNGPYVPYAMTNRELTEKSIIKDVSGYSWDSAIDGTKDITVKRYGAIVSVYGYFNTTNALAQYANVLSGLPHCASGASLSADIVHNMGMTLQNVDSATSKFVVNAATTANLQYAFNFVYLTDK